MHLCQQAWDDLHVFRAIFILLPIDLGRLCTTLLLRLTRFDPLLHRKMLPKFSQVVVLQTKTVQQRAVGYGIEDNVVVGPEIEGQRVLMESNSAIPRLQCRHT